MSLKQTVYFMALVGAGAGLLCWAIQSWTIDFVGTLSATSSTLMVSSIMGALIGGFTVGFADRWTTDRVVLTWILVGTLLGGAAGALGGSIYALIIMSGVMPPGLVHPLEWMVTGGLIGFVTGLRWFGVNRLRSVHALIGGLVGGLLGGTSFYLSSLAASLIISLGANALSYMIAGMGITLGVTLAPVLLRDGVLLFISSADPRAQNKYAGPPPQQWVIQDGDRFVVGSQGAESGMTMYARPVDIYIPDAMVAKRHAVLFAANKRFFVQQHQDNVGPQGQPLKTLQHNQTNVTGTHELRNGDELIVGQTMLQFSSRRQAPEPRQGGRY
jgi:hypothetical protein